jgi:hypothetical protein
VTRNDQKAATRRTPSSIGGAEPRTPRRRIPRCSTCCRQHPAARRDGRHESHDSVVLEPRWPGRAIPAVLHPHKQFGSGWGSEVRNALVRRQQAPWTRARQPHSSTVAPAQPADQHVLAHRRARRPDGDVRPIGSRSPAPLILAATLVATVHDPDQAPEPHGKKPQVRATVLDGRSRLGRCETPRRREWRREW